jgi:hypothetical protein
VGDHLDVQGQIYPFLLIDAPTRSFAAVWHVNAAVLDMQGELLLLGLRKKLFRVGALKEIVLGLRRDIVTDDMEKAPAS